MTAAIAAADVMAKAAPVDVGPRIAIGDGLVTVAVHGDIDAVREALTRASEAPSIAGYLVASQAIGRPGDGLLEAFDLAVADAPAGAKGVPST